MSYDHYTILFALADYNGNLIAWTKKIIKSEYEIKYFDQKASRNGIFIFAYNLLDNFFVSFRIHLKYFLYSEVFPQSPLSSQTSIISSLV